MMKKIPWIYLLLCGAVFTGFTLSGWYGYRWMSFYSTQRHAPVIIGVPMHK